MCIFFFIYINTFEFFFFFFNDTATTEIYTLSYTLSLHDALPIYHRGPRGIDDLQLRDRLPPGELLDARSEEHTSELQSHSEISYAAFCLKKKIPPFRTDGNAAGALCTLLPGAAHRQAVVRPPRGSAVMGSAGNYGTFAGTHPSQRGGSGEGASAPAAPPGAKAIGE